MMVLGLSCDDYIRNYGQPNYVLVAKIDKDDGLAGMCRLQDGLDR